MEIQRPGIYHSNNELVQPIISAAIVGFYRKFF
jgi:hypothetical protein